jgi:hypothetical protein
VTSGSKLSRVAQIREAELPPDLDAVQRLGLAYLTWGNDGLEDRYGFRLPTVGLSSATCALSPSFSD